MKRVLFVCIGNACRSQMAETFARRLGQGFLEAESAGLFPLGSIPSETREAMREIGYDMTGQTSKPMDIDRLSEFDLVINMSGFEWPLPEDERLVTWKVADPYGESTESYREVRDRVESLVRQLVAEVQFATPTTVNR